MFLKTKNSYKIFSNLLNLKLNSPKYLRQQFRLWLSSWDWPTWFTAHRFIQGCSHWCLLDLFSSWSLCWRIDSTESIHMSTWAPHLQTQSCKPHSLFVVLHAICPCQALNTQTNVRHKSVYILPKLPPSQLPFLQIRRSGCNSTLPFKRDCFPFQEHFLLIFNQSLCYWKSNYSCDRFSACLPGVDIEAGHLNLNSKFRSHA